MPDSTRLPTGSSARRERAERILDTTAELLMLHGYRRVTIDDVARRTGIGKGTVYLHWKTREALFWATLGRESMRLLEKLIVDLSNETDLALPHRLMRAIFLEVVQRPLVRALLLGDDEVLGNLAKDETVARAQQELAGNENYLVLLLNLGLLRPGLTAEGAGHILESVMRGFFIGEDGESEGLSLDDRADLLADVLRRALEVDGPIPAESLATLNAQVIELFNAITKVQRDQLEDAF